MRRITSLVAALLLLIPSAYGQDGDTLQTGFAAVKAISGTGGGLMVFGRFGFRDGETFFQSSIWTTAVTTNTALVVGSDVLSVRDTGIAIVNPGNFTATITLTLRDREGTEVGTRTILLDPLHQFSRFVSELFRDTTALSVTGLLWIRSTMPIAVLGLQYAGRGFSVVPTVDPFGETALLLPQIATGGGWSTEVVIANTTSIAKVVQIDFHHPTGRLISSVRDVFLPPGGVAVILR